MISEEEIQDICYAAILNMGHGSGTLDMRMESIIVMTVTAHTHSDTNYHVCHVSSPSRRPLGTK